MSTTIFIKPFPQSDNPLREQPDSQAPIVPYPEEGYDLYSITAVELPWVQVNHLLEKNGVYGSDKWSEPIGWMRWYCGGEQRVRFPGPYELEDYYLNE